MDFQQDNLRWFGEGFTGFPKKLPDDVVEYIIFVIDNKLSSVETRERLQAFQRALSSLEKIFLKEYIWQREAIKIELVHEHQNWSLHGRTNYGDSVADEWLIVYFLRELSKEFKDAWIRVYDSDGEFLLIEAANALPKWLTPEVAENRVWINSHRLLIISEGKEEEPGPLKQTQALRIITDTPARPQQYLKIQKEAFHRLSGYPAAISENQHHATIPLPRKVAHVLHINPSYIAPIVEAFYLRDPISIRLLQPEKSKISLTFPPEQFIEVSVRFTKILYAQLLGQQWVPPEPYNTALENLMKSTEAAEKHEVGIKIAAGAQMLLSHRIFADRPAVREINLLLEDLESGDDTLPSDAEITAWPKREDDERWLNIDFSEFEKQLKGKGGKKEAFGDMRAQDNLKKMVERFNSFLADNEAGIDGADGVPDPMDVDNDSDAGARGWNDPEDSGEDEDENENEEGSDVANTSDIAPALQGKSKGPTKPTFKSHDENSDTNSETADAEFAEYEAAYEQFMTLSAAEKALLTDEARDLAASHDAEMEEDEEIKKLAKMMQAELFSHGALDLNPGTSSGSKKALTSKTAMANGANRSKDKEKEKAQHVEEDDESGDEDLLDEGYNLADNMLKAFKGQAGMAGPAGNLMALMGVQFPQDKDDEVPAVKGKGIEKN